MKKINTKDILDVKKSEDIYRKNFSGKIEDKVINGVHVNDTFIFPEWWWDTNDYKSKNILLQKSIKNNVPLRQLDEVKIIENQLLNKAEKNIDNLRK